MQKRHNVALAIFVVNKTINLPGKCAFGFWVRVSESSGRFVKK